MIVALFLLFILAACVQKEVSPEEIDLIKQLQEIEREQANTSDLDDLTGAVAADVPIDADDAEADADAEIDADASDVEADAPVEDIVGDIRDSLKNNLDVDTSTLQRIEVFETEVVDLQVDAADEDEDPLTFTFTSPLDKTGTWTTTYGDEGEYVVTITADDGTNTVEQHVLVVVNKKNVAPEMTNIPEKLSVDEGALVSVSPDILDLNDDEVTLTFSEPLDEDGTWQTDHTSSGDYVVTVTASDGESKTEKKVTLTVKNVNVPPEVVGLVDISIKEGESVKLSPTVSDLDGDKVTLTISEPVGNDGVWETKFTDNGDYVIIVTATDGKDTVKKEVNVAVADVNVPPKILGIKKG